MIAVLRGVNFVTSSGAPFDRMVEASKQNTKEVRHDITSLHQADRSFTLHNAELYEGYTHNTHALARARLFRALLSLNGLNRGFNGANRGGDGANRGGTGA